MNYLALFFLGCLMVIASGCATDAEIERAKSERVGYRYQSDALDQDRGSISEGQGLVNE